MPKKIQDLITDQEADILLEALSRGSAALAEDGCFSAEEFEALLYWARLTKINSAALECILRRIIDVQMKDGEPVFIKGSEKYINARRLIEG